MPARPFLVFKVDVYSTKSDSIYEMLVTAVDSKQARRTAEAYLKGIKGIRVGAIYAVTGPDETRVVHIDFRLQGRTREAVDA